MNRLKQILIAFDQLINAMLGGWADETLSSRAYRWDRDGIRSYPRKVIDLLFWWEDAHCEASYKSEMERLQCPPEMRHGK